MNLIYEDDTVVVFRGLNDLTIYHMEKNIIKEKLVMIYADKEDYMLSDYKIPSSDYLYLCEMSNTVSNDTILKLVKKTLINGDLNYGW